MGKAHAQSACALAKFQRHEFRRRCFGTNRPTRKCFDAVASRRTVRYGSGSQHGRINAGTMDCMLAHALSRCATLQRKRACARTEFQRLSRGINRTARERFNAVRHGSGSQRVCITRLTPRISHAHACALDALSMRKARVGMREISMLGTSSQHLGPWDGAHPVEEGSRPSSHEAGSRLTTHGEGARHTYTYLLRLQPSSI